MKVSKFFRYHLCSHRPFWWCWCSFLYLSGLHLYGLDLLSCCRWCAEFPCVVHVGLMGFWCCVNPLGWCIICGPSLWSIHLPKMLSVASKQLSIILHFDDITAWFSAFVYHCHWHPWIIFLKDRYCTADYQFRKIFCIPVVVLLFFAFVVHPFPDLIILWIIGVQQHWYLRPYPPTI